MDTMKAEVMAREMMDYYGLSHWEFKFDRAFRRAGACWHDRQKITVSREIVKIWDEDNVTDTVLHEIAHALVGAGAGHGPRWKRMAREVGAKPSRCYDPRLPQPDPTWIGICPNGHETFRHRRRSLSCAKCDSRGFNPDYLFTWERYNRLEDYK